MAKLTIPDALKADVPATPWGKILTATPVIMTVVATALAGLASSEMTRAQYSRSLAAQQQSKAGDQWGFFQAKRLRGALQRNTLDMLQSTTEVRPLNAAALEQAGAEASTIEVLTHGRFQVPAPNSVPPMNAQLQALLHALADGKPESEIAVLLNEVKAPAIADAVKGAQNAADAFDTAMQPVSQAVDRLEQKFASETTTRDARRDFIAARIRYTAARYEVESSLNRGIANLYEVQVRKSNLDAERHHNRSQQFFFGMLAAQAAVIISTFSLAAQKRSLLWSLAAAAGAAAIAFAVYVYLFV